MKLSRRIHGGGFICCGLGRMADLGRWSWGRRWGPGKTLGPKSTSHVINVEKDRLRLRKNKSPSLVRRFFNGLEEYDGGLSVVFNCKE